MDRIKQIGYLCLVFIAGGVVHINLAVMMYGVPEHYDAHWGKVAFAVFLAIVFWLHVYDHSARRVTMKDLIKALQIFLKYGNPKRPTHCTHDELAILGIDPDDVSDEDKDALFELGFFENTNEGDGYFYSFRFGSG